MLKKIENGESKYIKYLGCAKNKTYLRQYIETALTNTSIPKNNVRMALVYIADFSEENWDYAVDYYIKNFNRIEKLYVPLNINRLLHASNAEHLGRFYCRIAAVSQNARIK